MVNQNPVNPPPPLPHLTVEELIRRLKTVGDKTMLVTCSVPIGDGYARGGPVKGMTSGFDPEYGPTINIWAGAIR